MMALALLATSAHVQYFSWFAYGHKHLNHVALNWTHANLMQGGSLEYLLNQSMPSMLILPGQERQFSNPFAIFNETSRKDNGVWLVRDWRARVAAIAQAVADTRGKIVGVQIGDELVCGGLPLGNLSSKDLFSHESVLM